MYTLGSLKKMRVGISPTEMYTVKNRGREALISCKTRVEGLLPNARRRCLMVWFQGPKTPFHFGSCIICGKLNTKKNRAQRWVFTFFSQVILNFLKVLRFWSKGDVWQALGQVSTGCKDVGRWNVSSFGVKLEPKNLFTISMGPLDTFHVLLRWFSRYSFMLAACNGAGTSPAPKLFESGHEGHELWLK